MSKKNKTDFLENFSRHPELARKVLKQVGESFKEIKKRPYDYRDASAGVSGFIYYSDTVAFAKKNNYLIHKALNEFEEECGQIKKPTEDETQYLNWLSWFALENTIQEIIDYVEN